jgi:hypothetical protein
MLARFPPRSSTGPHMPASLLVRIIFWVWFGAAIAAGHFAVLQRTTPMMVQGLTLGLAALLGYAYFRISAARTWVDALDLRGLVLLHLTRFTGVYLLMLYQRGELPRAFAFPGGTTDIIVATMAIPVALAPLDPKTRQRAIVIWNVVGFLGILFTTLTAIRINLADPAQLRPLTHLPLSLLPFWLTPLLLATHVIIFSRTKTP